MLNFTRLRLRPGRRGLWAIAIGAALGAPLLALALALASAVNRPRVPPPAHWQDVARARAYLDRGRPDLTLKVVSRIRDEGPGAGEAMALAGMALIRYNQIRDARLALERGLRLQPNQPLAAKLLAAIYLSGNDSRRALVVLRSAARLDPADVRPWLVMGKVHHYHLGDYPRAVDAFTEALKRAPGDREARTGRIAALLAMNQTDQARPDLDEALRIWPEDPEVLSLAARQARDSGQTDAAIALADRALTLDPGNLDARLVRARTRLASRRPDLALDDLERAVEIDATNLGALQLLAQVETSLGLNDRAVRTLNRQRKARDRSLLMAGLTREISERPDDPEPQWKLGQTAMEGGQNVLAESCFRAALDLDPSCRPASAGLAALRAAHPPLPVPTRSTTP
ncbi:MAG: hypothetical protein NVSMB9_19640 [Isosphaeraceae bacterium]